MHLSAAISCLAAILFASGACVAWRTRLPGWFALVVSLLWFPLNNQVLEGPVLLRVTSRHGLTLSDLVGLAGFITGALTVWPPSTWRADRHTAVRLIGLAGLLVAAFGIAAEQTDLALY